MSSLVRYPGPGCVVEFLHGNRTNVAWVLAEQSGRYRLLLPNRRETKLPAARLLPWSGPAYAGEHSREEVVDILTRHDQEREALAAGVDPAELWELAQGDVARASAEWFASLLWDAPGPDRVAAVGRRMLEQKSHFKFQPPDFDIHPREKVEARTAELETQQRREHVVGAGQSLFRELWDCHVKGRPAPVFPAGPNGPLDPGPSGEDGENGDTAQALRAVLLAAMAEETGTPEAAIWATLRKGLPEDPHLPLLLAQAWGVVPEHFNAQLLAEGYAWGDAWSEPFADDIAAARQRLAALAREPEPVPYLSVDSATTRDIDDAFFVQRTPDGGYRLQLALACPALTWDFGSALDRAVRERASSLYLPEGTSHMLPEAYGLGLYSLDQGQPRPALVMDFTLDAAGALVCMQPRPAWVRVVENSTYEALEAALDGAAPDSQPALGVELGLKLRERRIARGAVVVDRPDPTITLTGQGAQTQVDIEQHPACPGAQTAVSEFMILANSAAGDWGREHGVALIHRTQDITLPGDAAGVWTSPEDAHRVVRLMAPTCQELAPRRHATIAAEAYAPLTSPLRRYADLVNMAQMLHTLEHGAPLWDAEALGRMLPHLTARTEAAGRIQRFRPRYWKLVYFRQNRKEQFEAVAVEDGQLVTLALPREQMYVRVPRQMLGDKIYPGQRFLIRLHKVNPLANELRVAEAWEQ